MGVSAIFASLVGGFILFPGFGVATPPEESTVAALGDGATVGVRSSGRRQPWVEGERFLMGTRLRIRVSADSRRNGIAVVERVARSVSEQEGILSSWSSDSEVARLNRAPVGDAVVLSRTLAGALGEVMRWSVGTRGALEPRLGALIDAWAIRGAGRIPAPSERVEALAAVGEPGIRLDFDAGTAERRHPAAWIDTGAFGKGAGLRAARAALRESGIENALLDFGGQLLALGSETEEERGWPVWIAHPVDRSQPTVGLRLTGVSVATSGASGRLASVDGVEVSHVIDPRSGAPVRPWGSVTVASEDPLAADAAATALFVLGVEEGIAWARERSDLGVLFSVLTNDGDLDHWWNDAMDPWVESAPGNPAGTSGQEVESECCAL